MVINTNTNAVEAASSLQRSQAALSRSIARLSSGSKIINPADDAAGLAVAEKLEAQNSRIRAAKVNAQNAVSFVQTADGFMQTMNNILNRMSELAMLATDVTKNTDDVALYGTEFDQLKQQLRDIVGNGPNGTDSAANWGISGTSPVGDFNGISLFGDRTAMSAVVGSSPDQVMSINAINLREIGGAMSDLLWDNSVDSGQADIDVSSSDVISTLTDAIQQIGEQRATLGAVQSRLEIVDMQLQVQLENLTAATSRIKDVDVAEESTRIAKYNILVQSGTAMLQQANALPQSVLRLLG